MQWVNSQIDRHGNQIFPKISRRGSGLCPDELGHSLSYKIRQLVWCFKIYWRYSMATGGWIFQTGDFTAVGISSRLWFSNFLPTDIFRLQTKFASHHDDDDYVAIETKASQQVWWSGVSSLVGKFAFVALIKGLNSNPPSWQYLCC